VDAARDPAWTESITTRPHHPPGQRRSAKFCDMGAMRGARFRGRSHTAILARLFRRTCASARCHEVS